MFRNTIVLTFCTLISQIFTFILQMYIASSFGASQEMDAYLAGITLPQYITTILTSAIAGVFIPVFFTYYTNSEEESWKVVSGIMNIFFISCIIITVLGVIFASKLIDLTVPGLSSSSKDAAYKVSLIFWPSVLFSTLQTILISFYQAKKKFLWQAFIPIIASVSQLILVYLFRKHFNIFTLAFISLIGIILPTLFLSKVYFNVHFKYKFFWKHKGIIEFLRLFLPLIIANLFLRITPIVERFLASDMYTGSISHLNYASKINTIISTLVTIGLSTIIFPLFSEALAKKDLSLFKQTFVKGISNMLLILAPIISIGVVLSLSGITVVFERGEFTPVDSLAVSNLFQIYLISLIASSLGAITGKSLYALKMTKLISIVGVIESVLYIVYTHFLALKFGIFGVALGYVLYFFISFSWHMIVIYTKTKATPGSLISLSYIKTMVSAIIASLLVYLAIQLVSSYLNQLILGLIVGLFSYLIFLYILRTEEILILKRKIVSITQKLG